MPFGALFRNGNNVRVIGDDVESLVLTSETGSAPRRFSGIWNQYEIPHVAGRIPIFELTSNMIGMIFYFAIYAGVGNGMPALLNLRFNGTAPASIPYRYLCGSRDYTGPVDSYGMRLFDETGKRTYDSAMPLARVMRVQRPNGGTTFPMQNGRWLAIPFWSDIYDEDDEGMGEFLEVGVASRSGSTENWDASFQTNYSGVQPTRPIGCIMEIAIAQ